MTLFLPNKITGANAGGPRQLAMRTRWAARIAQFWRWATSRVMEQKHTGRRWIRGSIAAFIGLLILAATLPSTGGMIEGARPGMWRCGPFLFYPGAFFGVVGVVTVSTACTLFGIARGSAFEIVGWILLGVLYLCVLMR